MTLLVENLHLAVNKKQAKQTFVAYTQKFATAVRESIKLVTKCTNSQEEKDGILYQSQEYY